VSSEAGVGSSGVGPAESAGIDAGLAAGADSTRAVGVAEASADAATVDPAADGVVDACSTPLRSDPRTSGGPKKYTSAPAPAARIKSVRPRDPRFLLGYSEMEASEGDLPIGSVTRASSTA
jgi:hypothetical protein